MTEPAYSPPHNLEAEQAVLGAVFVDPAVLPDLRIILRRPGVFWRVSHQHIWKAVLKLGDDGHEVDWVSVVEEIRKAGALDACGGNDALAAYLSDITHGVPSAYGGERYALIVRDCALRREMALRCGDGRARALDDTLQAGEALHATINSLTELEAHTVHREPRLLADVVNEARAQRVAMQEWRRNNPAALPGLSCGYRDLDAYTTGWKGGELIVVGGRPGEGKSSLVNSFALHCGKGQLDAMQAGLGFGAVLLFSQEMTALENTRRLIAARAGVDATQYRVGMLTRQAVEDVVEAEHALSALPILMDDDFDTTATDMLVKARRLRDRKGLACVFVDYIQIVRAENEREDRHLQIGRVTRGLKRLARQLDVPVIAAAQLGRDVEKGPPRRPRLSDLRESGSIENDADQVLFIHRKDRDDPDNNLVELIIAKNRNGPTATIELYFDRKTTSFLPVKREFQPKEAA